MRSMGVWSVERGAKAVALGRRAWLAPTLVGMVCALALSMAHEACARSVGLMSDAVLNRCKKGTVFVWIHASLRDKEDWDRLGSGSGEFINATGMFVTNNHVVNYWHGAPPEQAQRQRRFLSTKITIVVDAGTKEQKEYDCEVIYTNESADIAICQAYDKDGALLDTHDRYFEFYPTNLVIEGDRVYNFGFPGATRDRPEGEYPPVDHSHGQFIGVPRTANGRLPWIDTDVNSAPGSSGGPLVSVDGRLVGTLSQGGPGGLLPGMPETGRRVIVRMVPGAVVQDMVRRTLKYGILSSDTDLTPFLDVMWDYDSKMRHRFFPRRESEDELVLTSEDRIGGNFAIDHLSVSTPLGDFAVPVKCFSYIFTQDQFGHAFLRNHDRLLCNAGKTVIDFEPTLGSKMTQRMNELKAVAFREQLEEELKFNTEKAWVLDGPKCRLTVRDVKGKVKLDAGGSPVELDLTDVNEVQRMEDGSVMVYSKKGDFAGNFLPHQIEATLVCSGEQVALKLTNFWEGLVREATPPPSWYREVIEDVGIADEEILAVAKGLDCKDPSSVKDRAKALVSSENMKTYRPVERDRANILYATSLLRQGDYREAISRFNQSKKTEYEDLALRASSSVAVLEQHKDEDFKYEGKPLKDLDTFREAGRTFAQESVDVARKVVEEYRSVSHSSAPEYDKLVSIFNRYEANLLMASHLERGSGEPVLLNLWQIAEETHEREARRLAAEFREIEKKMQELARSDRANAADRIQKYDEQLRRLYKAQVEALQLAADVRAKLREAGFRIDDPVTSGPDDIPGGEPTAPGTPPSPGPTPPDPGNPPAPDPSPSPSPPAPGNPPGKPGRPGRIG